MNETLEQQIRRLEFCRNCIVLDYDAGKEEYNRLEMVIEELKKKKYMNKIKKTGIQETPKVLMTVEEYQAVLLGLSEIEAISPKNIYYSLYILKPLFRTKGISIFAVSSLEERRTWLPALP